MKCFLFVCGGVIVAAALNYLLVMVQYHSTGTYCYAYYRSRHRTAHPTFI
jgi:hypothetical protein